MIYDPETRTLIDDDGQVVATLEDNALDEQGFALAEAYNHDADADAERKRCVQVCLQTAEEMRAVGAMREANGAAAAANAIARVAG